MTKYRHTCPIKSEHWKCKVVYSSYYTCDPKIQTQFREMFIMSSERHRDNFSLQQIIIVLNLQLSYFNLWKPLYEVRNNAIKVSLRTKHNYERIISFETWFCANIASRKLLKSLGSARRSDNHSNPLARYLDSYDPKHKILKHLFRTCL